MKLVDSQTMRALESYTIEEVGIPSAVLMENAGRILAESIAAEIPPHKRKKILLVCGRGNNGGDGFVAARHLWSKGYHIKVFLTCRQEELREGAKLSADILHNLDIPVFDLHRDDVLQEFRRDVRDCLAIVDGIFGTGLNAPLQPFDQNIISLINGNPSIVYAVDIPSGLAGNGELFGTPIKATKTITFGYPKVGFYRDDNEEKYCGDIIVADIGIPKTLPEKFPFHQEILTLEEIRGLTPVRARYSHKGDFGHVFIIGGSPGKTGAAMLAARAALATGAGLATLGLSEDIFEHMYPLLTEIMAESLPLASGIFGKKAASKVIECMEQKNVLVVGPGLSLPPHAGAFLEDIFSLNKPMLLDAECINKIALSPELLRPLKGKSVVLTPHPGEFARLVDLPVAEVQKNRLALGKTFAEKHQIYLLLKGYRSVLFTPEGTLYINPTGNPGMATAGMGDTLCGIMAASICQIPQFVDALKYAVFLHGYVGDHVAKHKAKMAIVASDIIDHLGDVLRKWEA